MDATILKQKMLEVTKGVYLRRSVRVAVVEAIITEAEERAEYEGTTIQKEVFNIIDEANDIGYDKYIRGLALPIPYMNYEIEEKFNLSGEAYFKQCVEVMYILYGAKMWGAI